MENDKNPITPPQSDTETEWTHERILDLVRKLRNDLIKDFLDERNVLDYFSKQYNPREISSTRLAFMKKELKELLITPVNETHYATLIEHIRESGTASLSDKYEPLFFKEVEVILRKYIY